MISNYLANNLLAHVFGDTPYSPPATFYVALFTTMPNADGSGGVEVSGGSYARAASTNDVSNWPDASSRVKANAIDITFVQASAEWGSVVGAGIYDALSSGNLLVFGEFSNPIEVHLNGVVSFTPNQFTATVS